MLLVAEYLEDPNQRVFVEVESQPVKIGRNPTLDAGEDAVVLRIPWNDRLVNRNHSVAEREGSDLVIRRLPATAERRAPNSLYTNSVRNRRELLSDPHRLQPGDSFVIGSQGRTAFYWLKHIDDLDASRFGGLQDSSGLDLRDFHSQDVPASDYEEVSTMDPYSLRLQLRLLQRELPEQVLSGWTTETDLYLRAASFLQNAMPGQKGVAAAFLAVDADARSDGVDYRLLNPDPNTRADFQPSRTLLGQISLAQPSADDLYVWESEDDELAFSTHSLGRSIDWIAALPVCSAEQGASVIRDEQGDPVYLYVETREATSTTASTFAPFLRLICSLVASLLAAREKQRIQDQMSAYFSPALRERLGGDQDALEPALTDCTVLFCDRAGSSRILETAISDEQILDQLSENQAIVGEITETVFEHEGVVTDFAGDGALALWGWPSDLESSDEHSYRAVSAARDIIERLGSRTTVDPETHRRLSCVRIGVSSGRIAVGKTGPAQQMHISVFGNVVNLGARLERIAKEFKVPVLLSDQTAARLHTGRFRIRRLCYIKPAGFTESYPIYELVLPRGLGGSGIDQDGIELYEQALDRFVQREWETCLDQLSQLPENDTPAKWLAKRTRKFLKQEPDSTWQGEIVSLVK